MKVIYIGDVMGPVGIEVLQKKLPLVLKKYQPDLVLAQAENLSDGKGVREADMRLLQSLGVDFFTGGNHTPRRPDSHKLLEDPNEPIIGPANMGSCPGVGYKKISRAGKTILVVTLLGQTVGHEIKDVENPLKKIDQILEDSHADEIIVNFHGDFSSEKRIIGYYLDGRVSAVIGDHWHVPSADADILPKGTVHITDVGMCGSLDSSLGVAFSSVIPRWRDEKQTKNTLEIAGRRQFNALFFEVNNKKATKVELIQDIS